MLLRLRNTPTLGEFGLFRTWIADHFTEARTIRTPKEQPVVVRNPTGRAARASFAFACPLSPALLREQFLRPISSALFGLRLHWIYRRSAFALGDDGLGGRRVGL